MENKFISIILYFRQEKARLLSYIVKDGFLFWPNLTERSNVYDGTRTL